ncbi:hypothetical protein [Nonomuraea roseola]|uniref:Uncharacterized protein n=1 Tax=Nonomuraea roseola TaxID=46179 RepID=A0ABV5PUL2_9ACTN
MKRVMAAFLCVAALLTAPPAHAEGRPLPIRGADVSSLAKSEALGGVYRDAEGRRGDPLRVFTWEATWTAVRGNGWDPADPASGNAWENQALFGFDDRALPATRALGGR